MQRLVKNIFISSFAFLLLLILTGIATAAPVDSKQKVIVTPFHDVSSSDANAVYINYMTKRGIISGFPDGSFHPGEGVTRAQAAVLVTKVSGLKANPGNSSFSDVGSSHWAAGYINAAAAAGYISGFPDGSFHPEESLTRAQGISLFLRLTGQSLTEAELPQLQDLNSSHWAASAIATAIAAGMIETENNSFKPDQAFKRGDLARALSLLITKAPDLNQQELIGQLKVKTGTVDLKRAGSEKTQTINTTSIVRKGDTVFTGKNGEAEINYPDGSGILLKPNSQLIIKTSIGRAYIVKGGKPGTAVEDLQLELTDGKLFGALASKYTGKEETKEETEKTASYNKYGQIASRDKNFGLMAAKTSEQPWYKTAEKKKVKVKVDMPWGVAAIRGTFWGNTVSNTRCSMSLLEGDGELSGGGLTRLLLRAQSCFISTKGGTPSPSSSMSPSEAREWLLIRDWVEERINEIINNQSTEGLDENIETGLGEESLAILTDLTNLLDILDNAMEQLEQIAASEPSGNSNGVGGSGGGGGGGGTISPQVKAPSAPSTGNYDSPQSITLSSDTDGATIYYTTDGSDPKISSTRLIYNGPIIVEQTTTIRAYATRAGMIDSDVVNFSYIINLNMIGNLSSPSLAYNAECLNYLMVYEKYDGNNSVICGQLWPTDGSSQGPEFIISGSGVNREPVVAVDPNSMNYLVLWSDQGDTPAIRGQLVNPSEGSLEGTSFTVYADENNKPQFKPNIAYNYSGPLVLWQEGDSSSDSTIMGRFITFNDNTPNMGEPISFSQGAGNQHDPAVACNNSEYLVVFNDGNNLKGILIGEGYITNPISIPSGNGIQGSGAVIPIYDYNSEYRFLVAWQDQRDGNFDIMARFVGTTFVNDTPTMVLGDELTITDSSNQETCPSLASIYDHYLIAWQDKSLDNDIKARMLYPDGTPAGSIKNIASVTGEQVYPAMTSMNNKVIVAYEDQGISPYTIGRYLFDESPPPKAEWIIVTNNATGDDEVTTPYQLAVIPVSAVVKVYDDNGLLGSGTAEMLGNDGYYPPHIVIPGGFAPGVEGIYVTTTLEGNQESESTFINLPIPVMVEGTDYSVDTVNCGYGKIAYKVNTAQKVAMETATGKTIATIKAYTTTERETTFANLAEAEATSGAEVPVGDTGVAVAKDPGNYGYAIAAYDANNQVVAYYVSDGWETVWSGLGVNPSSVNASSSFNQTFTLTLPTNPYSAGTFKDTNLSSYITLKGLFTDLTRGTVTRVSSTQITVEVSGNLISQTGNYGEICVAAEAFENAPEPGGAVRQVAQVTVKNL
jgi:hypothetical protein